jgi:hypothetical protein
VSQTSTTSGRFTRVFNSATDMRFCTWHWMFVVEMPKSVL